jgi:predicted phosphodiesterase
MLTLRPTVERAAVITDIHANLPALEAVLDAIGRSRVDAADCGGDLVGYGPHPNEVCTLIEEHAIPTIHGNYDYSIARDLEDCGCGYRDRDDREIGQRSVEWTLAHTGSHSKDFMRGLPFDARFVLGNQRVRLGQGSPRTVIEYAETLVLAV